jgi:hypothetical protein
MNSLISSLAFRGLVERLVDLGPRAVGELLAAIANDHAITQGVFARLEEIASLPPMFLHCTGGDEWPPVPPLRGVP